LVLMMLLLSAVSGVYGQGVQELVSIKNESVTYSFLSRFAPVIGRSPNNGSVTLVEDPTFNYTLTYTPDADFTGSDDLLLVSFPFEVNVAFTEFDISVVEAKIDCRHDFAVTTSGIAVSIPVGDNDFSNVGELELVAAPVVNAGTAEVVNGEILFSPSPGFTGLTDLNYVSCAMGVCDLGTVSVNVLPEAGQTGGDTMRVFTSRRGQFIFAPEGATPLTTPVNGSVMDSNGVMAYVPNEDFLGDEFLTYAVEGVEEPLVFHVTALDVMPNVFAKEDRGYTTPNQSTTLNVLHNDLYSVFAGCVSFGTPRFGSLVEGSATGEVTYIPPTGWSGVDQFTYSSKPPGCEGEAEVETVYVVVSNYAPAATENQLTTPAGTPLKITYDVPGGQAAWSVVSQPTLGTIVTDSADGHLRYLPASSAAGQTDYFTIQYCLNQEAGNNCEFSAEIPVTVAIGAANTDACMEEDCIWPGDTNNDGVVDVSDLLPIGLAMGRSGTPRLSLAPTSWSAQYGEDWGTDFNGLDLKYIDANGDQIISSADTQVVMANIGLAHRLRSEPQTVAAYEVNLGGILTAEPGDLVVLDINMGTNVVITEDVFGFTFPFVYDPNVVNANSVGIAYDEGSWLSYDSPILSLTNNKPGQGRIESALTRTSDGRGVSGFGKIGELSVVITEDVFGFKEIYGEQGDEVDNGLVISLGGDETGKAMNSAGHLDAVKINPHQLTITRQAPTDATEFTPVEASDYLDGKLQAFPNPTANKLTIHLNGQQRFSALSLTDLTGRTLIREEGLDTNHRELSLGQLPNGIYALQLTTEAGVVNRKVEVLR
ncbi:MAG: Ig-like domain-containing protein, partial [Bacteroidota bacterium]